MPVRSFKDDDTITIKELIQALHFTGKWDGIDPPSPWRHKQYSMLFAADLFEKAREMAKPKEEPVTREPKCTADLIPGNTQITLDELIETLRLRGYGSNAETNPRAWFKDTLERREPREHFVPGDIVLSHYKGTFIKRDDGFWDDPVTGSRVAHDYPTRPLKLIGRKSS